MAVILDVGMGGIGGHCAQYQGVGGRPSLIGPAQNCPPEMGNDKVKNSRWFFKNHSYSYTHTDSGPRLGKAHNIGLILDYWSIVYKIMLLVIFSLHIITFNLLFSNPSHGIGKQTYNCWF